MRWRAALVGLVLVAAGCGGGHKAPAAPTGPPPQKPVKVTIHALTHHPKVKAKWRYQVTASRAGKLTVQIVDPLGNAHPVQYDEQKRNVTDFPFKGRFRDHLEFPSESQGYRLVVRATVTSPAGRGTATYWVESR